MFRSVRGRFRGRARSVALGVGGGMVVIGSLAAGLAVGRSDGAVPSLFDGARVHDVVVTFDADDYAAMIDAFRETGDKVWIEATVTIDGVTYERAGLRLKGNSSLGGLGGASMTRSSAAGAPAGSPVGDPPTPVGTEPGGESADVEPICPAADGQQGSTTGNLEVQPPDSPGQTLPDPDEVVDEGPASADDPESLPWLIRLDEFVEGQDHQGHGDLLIRSAPTATSLNEAVALELLDEAGLASQDAAATRFRVNDSDTVLRLMVEHPDDGAWQDANFGSDGALYKAEADGDWSYRGDDPAAYAEVFDQEGGDDVADLTPLIQFLAFLDESDDATFADELPQRLDVDAFATYLAMMELLDNWDDIDGPGNNAYLWYELADERFTIVPWDMNLALLDGGSAGGTVLSDDAGATCSADDGSGAAEPDPPTDGAVPAEVAGRDEAGSDDVSDVHPLADRFLQDAEFRALYEDRLAELRGDLFDSGAADAIVDSWVATLTSQASDVVDRATVIAEGDRIAEQFNRR